MRIKAEKKVKIKKIKNAIFGNFIISDKSIIKYSKHEPT